MKARQCSFCPTMIAMILTKDRRWTPVEPASYKRMGSAPLAKGHYYDKLGEKYDQDSVPNGIPVYRSHWGDCPGAKEARKA